MPRPIANTRPGGTGSRPQSNKSAYNTAPPVQEQKKRKRKRKARTEDFSSDSESSSSSSSNNDSDKEEEDEELAMKKNAELVTKEVTMAEADSPPEESADEGLDDSSSDSSSDEEAPAKTKTKRFSDPKDFEKSNKIPKLLQELHGPVDPTKQKFEEYYMKLLTAEFGDDLNSIRQAKDFNSEKSLLMLVKALKGGVDGFTQEEMRTAVGEAA